MNRPALPAAVASNLLWAAAALDAAALFACLQVFGPLALALLKLFFPDLTSTFYAVDPTIARALNLLIIIISFIILLLIYWLISEIFLTGRTIGRIVLGLSIRKNEGGRPSKLQITKRGFTKISSLGLTGLAIGRLDAYDRNNNIGWASPMIEGAQSAARNLKIEVRSGQGKGTSHALEQLPNFKRHRGIQIGRDQTWADILLDQDGNVSNRHAVLRLRPSGWEVMDYGGGKGSSNKTFLNGNPLHPLKWYSFRVGEEIKVADVKIRLVDQITQF